MIKTILVLVFSLLFFGCSSKPVVLPDSQTPKNLASKAFDRINKSRDTVSNKKIDPIFNPEFIPDKIIETKTNKPGWVEVEETRTFSNSVSPDNAKHELLQILRSNAISKKIPENVEISSLLTDVMSESAGKSSENTAWSGFFKSTVSGVITQEEILIDNLEPGKNEFKKTIRLKAYVEPVHGNRDPGFFINAKLDKKLLKSGDELFFEISPSKDCYIYAFNFMADKNIMLLFPNEYMQNNFIKGNSTLQVPSKELRNYLKFIVTPMPGETITAESIYIVCSKEKLPLDFDLPKIEKTLPLFSRESDHFVKLQRWLVNIPLDQRVEKNLMYHVSGIETK